MGTPSKAETDSILQVAIKDGGTAAGLQILRFIKAPIAAAIAHNLNEGPHYDDELNVVIFDLGSRGIGEQIL